MALVPIGRFAGCGNDRTARVWDVATADLRHTFGHGRARTKDDPGAVLKVAISADGHRLATAALGGAVRVWSLHSGTFRYWMDTGVEPHDLIWLPDTASLPVGDASDAYLFELCAADARDDGLVEIAAWW
jgi:WD40 repeat protein